MDIEPPDSILLLLGLSDSAIFSGILLLALLFCSALISGAEVALFSLTKAEIDKGIEEGSDEMQVVSDLLEKPKKLLATILVANNFINIAIVLLFAYLGEFLFSSMPSPLVKFLVEVVTVTFLILLFGEIIPKIYASRNNVRFSSFMAKPLKVLDTIFSPFSTPMRYITLRLERKLGSKKSNLSVDQLSQALELTNQDDTTDEEQKILESIVSFGNTDTKQVMRPRMDIFALDSSLSFEKILPQIIDKGYSRIPVYEENIDKVIGILYAKDLLPYISKEANFKWQQLIRDPFFVPENKKLDDLMQEFQKRKVHLAVVVDEYGGTSGIVSLEDIIEEIVGDISDEYDDDDLNYTKIDDSNYRFDGKTTLKDLYKIIEIEDSDDFEQKKGEAETIAGFILEISGGFPRIGSKINFKNFVFTVESLEKRRIKQIKLTILK
ncbi:gliding motility-associated protein GldE [Winogradskyella aurantiaca]|uniref:gliding motility-associated protein GldE n=1 Tax=Winogradskyella aurantiaca TaxID=2219558 RepID=UPI000E1DBB3C|nr:gliding motility-associated protein GldE [Winogradskyella aurantiaca]